jgi:hypothetical protein
MEIPKEFGSPAFLFLSLLLTGCFGFKTSSDPKGGITLAMKSGSQGDISVGETREMQFTYYIAPFGKYSVTSKLNKPLVFGVLVAKNVQDAELKRPARFSQLDSALFGNVAISVGVEQNKTSAFLTVLPPKVFDTAGVWYEADVSVKGLSSGQKFIYAGVVDENSTDSDLITWLSFNASPISVK